MSGLATPTKVWGGYMALLLGAEPNYLIPKDPEVCACARRGPALYQFFYTYFLQENGGEIKLFMYFFT